MLEPETGQTGQSGATRFKNDNDDKDVRLNFGCIEKSEALN